MKNKRHRLFQRILGVAYTLPVFPTKMIVFLSRNYRFVNLRKELSKHLSFETRLSKNFKTELNSNAIVASYVNSEVEYSRNIYKVNEWRNALNMAVKKLDSDWRIF